MFINRPLIHHVRSSTKPNPTRNTSSHSTDPKNKIRIKTLPGSVHQSYGVSNKHIRSDGMKQDSGLVEGNLIGIKDVREMIDEDVAGLLERLEELEGEMEGEERRVEGKCSKVISKKSTILGQAQKGNTNTKDILQRQFTLQEEEQRAYNECVSLLMQQNAQQQKMHDKYTQQLSSKFCQLQQTRLQLQNLKKATLASVTQTRTLLHQLQQQTRTTQKRLTNKQLIIQQITHQRAKITQMTQSLYLSRQQSLTQKNQFIDIQAEQLKIIKLIEEYESEEAAMAEEWENFQYYKKLQKLKGKLKAMREKQSGEVERFMDERIAEIVKVRVRGDQVDVEIERVSGEVEEQVAIVEMLMRKHGELEVEDERQAETAQSLYKAKYNQIFLSHHYHQPNTSYIRTNNLHINNRQYLNTYSDNSDNQFRQLDHWKNYKSYLEKILKHEKRLNEFDGSVSKGLGLGVGGDGVGEYGEEEVYGGYEEEQEERRRKSMMKLVSSVPSKGQNRKQTMRLKSVSHQSNNTNTIHKPSTIASKQPQESTKNPKPQHPPQRPTIHLPRLIKMQGRLSDKDKIKNELTKFTNNHMEEQEGEIELQTVRSSEVGEGEQGDVIEVEFTGVKGKGRG